MSGAGLIETAAIAVVALNKLPIAIVTVRAHCRAAQGLNGVGFEIGLAFQLFDVTRILACALAFIAVMLAIETFLVQPLERHVARWRPRPA